MTWLTFQLTGSSTWVGVVVACRIAPIALLAIPMGSIADRFSRRNIVIWSHACLTAVTAVMAVLGFAESLTPLALAVFGALGATGIAWTLPAWHALYPSSVPEELISPAVGAHTVAAAMAGTVGPLIAGGVIAWWGPAVAILINALTYVPVIFAASRIKSPEAMTPAGRTTTEGVTAARLMRTLMRPGQMWVFACVVVATAQAVSMQTVLPDHVDALFGSAGRYGALLGVFGFGAVAGALARGRLSRHLPSEWSVPALLTLLGCALALFAGITAIGTMALVLFGAGFAAQAALTTLEADTQVRADATSRGRTMSLYVVVQLATGAGAAILAGRVATEVGVGTAMRVVGLFGVACAIAVWVLRPRNQRLAGS